MRLVCLAVGIASAIFAKSAISRAEELPKLTTLSDALLKYEKTDSHYVVLKRGDVTAVIVDNHAVDDDVLPGHRAGYSGVASLTHTNRSESIFVPSYAGLNFEHIHDGTLQDRKILFEPRHAPMELRLIDAHTAELYQPPTPHYGLESCHRYRLLKDGTIEMTFECIPRRATFKNGYVGLFWASYIHQPASLDIHFRGRHVDRHDKTQWVRGVTPSHGVLSTHVGRHDDRHFPHDDDFPLTLVFNRSKYRFDEPWYFGVNHSMALALMFPPAEQPRPPQPPSGGGRGNPAWDFQYFLPNYKVDRRYQTIMRAQFLPYLSGEQVRQATADNRRALSQK